MTDRKFEIDDVISLGSRMINVPAGPFTVRERHETDRGQFSYRVRCAGEPFDRVVEERQIRGLVPSPQSGADVLFVEAT